MIRLTSTDVRCALFASALQQSDRLSAEVLVAAISGTIEHLGLGGCLDRVAQEFGDHPESASERMRWIGQLDLPCTL
jgi:hypothetical protein